jgi:phage host-nuclease inhibitor protein Gam
MTRIRLTKTVIASRAEAETVLGEIAAGTAQLNALRAGLDQEITAARQRYEQRIDALQKQNEQKSGLLQQWAEGSPESFPEGRKSIELLHGRIGFRTSTPALKTVAGWTFKRALEVIDRLFVRTKEELDKEAVLAAYARGDLSDSELKRVGLRVAQEESFFVEPKLEEVDAK